jgi:uncharacterized FlaG/YvyC family protein
VTNYDDMKKNLQGLQRLSESFSDDSPVQSKLMQGAVEMMMTMPNASQVIAEALMEMAEDLNKMAAEINTLHGGLQYADAFCALAVGELLDIIDNNSITEFSDQQLEMIELAHWVSTMSAQRHSAEDITNCVKELNDARKEVNNSTNVEDIRKLVEDE